MIKVKKRERFEMLRKDGHARSSKNHFFKSFFLSVYYKDFKNLITMHCRILISNMFSKYLILQGLRPDSVYQGLIKSSEPTTAAHRMYRQCLISIK